LILVITAVGCGEDVRSGAVKTSMAADAGQDTDGSGGDSGEDGGGGSDTADDDTGGCTPVEEVCDGLDNDCDGAVDEGVERACGVAVGACVEGVERCEAGQWGACDAPVLPGAQPERCDGLDNDCDGDTDEGCACLDGAERTCMVGLCDGGERCMDGAWSGCVATVAPLPEEVCDGQDSDCDGEIDEGCACQLDAWQDCLVGGCAGMQPCVAGQWGACGPVAPPSEEVCNGEDDDCDGEVDEALTRVCGTAEGVCEEGEQTCLDGAWGECQGDVPPALEVCDGRDVDCNGAIDDVAAGLGAVTLAAPGLGSDRQHIAWVDAQTAVTVSTRDFQVYAHTVDVLTGELIATSPALTERGQGAVWGVAASAGIVGILHVWNDSSTGDQHWRVIQINREAQPLTSTEIVVAQRADAGGSLTAQGPHFVAAVTDRLDSGTENEAHLVWVRWGSGSIAGHHRLPPYDHVEVYGEPAAVLGRGEVQSGSNHLPSSFEAATPDVTPSLVANPAADNAACTTALPIPEGFAFLFGSVGFDRAANAYRATLRFQVADLQGRQLSPPRTVASTLVAGLYACGDPLILSPLPDGALLAAWNPSPAYLARLSPQGDPLASASGWLEPQQELVTARALPAGQVEAMLYDTDASRFAFGRGFPLACEAVPWEPLEAGAPCDPTGPELCPRGAWCSEGAARCVVAEAPVITEVLIASRPATNQVILRVNGQHAPQGLVQFEVTRLDAAQHAQLTTTSRVNAFGTPIQVDYTDPAFTATPIQIAYPDDTVALSVVAVDALGYVSAPAVVSVVP